MATAQVTVTNGKVFNPLKVRILQDGGNIDTISFSISPYIFSDVNLSEYGCYAVTLGRNNNIDESRLPFVVENGTMVVTWALSEYTLSSGDAIIYQLVFKSNDGVSKVWTTHKGLIYANSSLEACEHEPEESDYPTILRQFELDIGELESLLFHAYEWMPIGAWTPIRDRIKRRFYLKKLTDYDNSCIIEDDEGEVVSISAKSISCGEEIGNLPENLEGAISEISKRTSINAKFCANFGNLDDDGATDIIDAQSGILAFKIGDQYNNLIATQANGTTFELTHAESINCSSMPDGDYNVFVYKSGKSRLFANTIYRQIKSPDSPQNNDIWFCAPVGESKQWNTSGYEISQLASSIDGTIVDVAGNGSVLFAATKDKVFKSGNHGTTWSQSITADGITCCRCINGIIFVGKNNGSLLYTEDDGTTWSTKEIRESEEKTCGICFYGDTYFAFFSDGKVFASADLENWEQASTIGNNHDIRCVEHHGGVFIACGFSGKIFKSTDGTTWTEKQSNTGNNLSRIRWLTGNTWAICSESFESTLAVSADNGETWSNKKLPGGTSTIDAAFTNGTFVVSANDCIMHGNDFSDMEIIPGNNRHYTVIYLDLIFGESGKIAAYSDASCWYNFDGVPVGSVSLTDGEITNFENFEYNQNGFVVNSGTIANNTFRGLIKTASENSEKDDTDSSSAITPANVFRMLSYRKSSSAYSVGDIVGCQYHVGMSLKCTTAGTTSQEILDTSIPLEIGNTIVDGTVVWTVVSSGGVLENIPIEECGDLIVGDVNGAPSRLPIGSSGQILKVGDDGLPGWETESSSGMENPMTTAGDIIVGGTSGNPSRLGIGNSGDVLKVSSGGNVSWGNIPGGMENPMTTAGDIIVGGTSGNPSRLGIGNSGQILSVNSTSNGVEWKTGIAVSNQSLSQNGYVKFSNGLVIQWGSSAFGSTNRKLLEITFPTAFSNENFSFSGTIKANVSGTDRHLFSLSENSRTTTTISVVLYGADSATIFNGVSWMAIGYES